MQDRIKLTREMVLFLTFIGVLGNILYTHTWISNLTDRSEWVASLLGILLIIPFAIWLLYLGNIYPDCTIFDILEKGLGKLPCIVFCIIFIIINIAVAVAQLNMFTEMLRVFFLEYTLSRVIILFLILMCLLFVSSGIVVIGRLVEILAVIGILNYFGSFIFAFPHQVHIEYIIPIFDTSFSSFLKGALFMTGSAAECLLMLMIIVRFIPDPLKHYKWVVSGIALCAIVFSFAVMIIIAIMSPELAKRVAFGGVNAAKVIQVGEYIRGLEIFVFGSYQLSAIGKTVLCMYCSWIAIKKIFGNKKAKLQLIFVAALIFLPSFLLRSYISAYSMGVFLGSYILLPFSVVVLMLTTISIWIKNKKTGSTIL